MKSIGFTLLLAMTLLPGLRFSPNVSGCVIDESGEALIYVNVQVEGTDIATTTDLDGCFRLEIPEEEARLTFTYLGFESFTTTVKAGDEPLAITLKPQEEALEEVTVTSYATGALEVRGRRAMSAAGASDSSAPPPPPPPPAVIEEVPTPADARIVFSPDTYEEVIEVRPATSAKRDASHSGATMSISEDDIADSRPIDPVAYETSEVLEDRDDIPTTTETEKPDAGQLTAGEVNDFSKWDMWADISQEDLARHRSEWQQYANHRYTLQLTNTDHLPVVNAAIQLVDGQGNVLWKARTDHSGKAELWAHFFQEVDRPSNGLEIRGEAAGQSFRLTDVTPFEEGINLHQVAAPCNDQPVVDVAFVVDATGSMSDEIRYLQAELLDVVERVKDSLPASDLQLGSVFYRDKGEEYLTRVDAFSGDPSATVNFIQGQSANGGGDTPEAVEDALTDAIETLKWRNNATTRLLFLVLDAPPHQEAEVIQKMQVLTAKAAALGIQIIPVSCSGIDKSTEYLMRCLALATNGTYTFLTNHSGIGNAHIEPSTDSYDVEHLNDLMVRLIVQFSSLDSCEPPVATTDEPGDVLPPRTLGFAASPEEAGWRYYPNPTSGPLTVGIENEGGTLYLADANGKLLRRFDEPNLVGQLDLSNYPAGSYWLRYEDDEGEWSQGRVLVLRR